MGRSEKEDPFRLGEVEGGVSIGCGRAGVAIACMSGDFRYARKKRRRGGPYGAMMIRAPGTGSVGRIEEGVTWASQPESSLESFEEDDEYQEPAWLASRMVILSGSLCVELELSLEMR